VTRSRRLALLADEISRCRACPRLVAHREAVGEVKRRAYAAETYWARPVPGFGDPDARLVIVGLAPGAHGANRTGRAFTGDRSGDFLYAALHRAGLASQAQAVSRADGLALSGVFITLPCRCVPPDNKPLTEELARCRPWFVRELEQLGATGAILALGAIAYEAVLSLADPAKHPAFAHGAESAVTLPWARGAAVPVVASYHVSQQNTQTGRLTAAMFDEVLSRAAHLAGLAGPQRGRHARRGRVEEAAVKNRRSK
jgi:uracil-DNA glycosylase family 4